jgi:Zn-finger nucleic acid-binding protein
MTQPKPCPQCPGAVALLEGTGSLGEAVCPACDGRLLEGESMSRVVEQELGIDRRTLKELPSLFTGRKLQCPACRKEMSALMLKGVPAELCLGCGALWLDAGELPKLSGGLHGEAVATSDEVERARQAAAARARQKREEAHMEEDERWADWQARKEERERLEEEKGRAEGSRRRQEGTEEEVPSLFADGVVALYVSFMAAFLFYGQPDPRQIDAGEMVLGFEAMALAGWVFTVAIFNDRRRPMRLIVGSMPMILGAIGLFVAFDVTPADARHMIAWPTQVAASICWALAAALLTENVVGRVIRSR